MPATRALSTILIAALLPACSGDIHERERFAVACKAYDFTPKQCVLLWAMKTESKSDSDMSQSMSGLAIGLSTGLSAGRR